MRVVHAPLVVDECRFRQCAGAVIEAAGGIVTDWRGGSALQGGRVLAAANRQVHAAALALLWSSTCWIVSISTARF